MTKYTTFTISHVHSRHVDSCWVPPQPCHWDCVFSHNFCGMKWMCWTTGSCWCCLSLVEVESSIAACSMIIYQFLCGFICVSLCQRIKIKPTNMLCHVFHVCMLLSICVYHVFHVCVSWFPCMYVFHVFHVSISCFSCCLAGESLTSTVQGYR